MVALNYAKVVLQEEGNTEFPTVMKLTKLFENWEYIMWKVQNFSTTQILREINFCGSRSTKDVIFAVLQPLKLQKIL